MTLILDDVFEIISNGLMFRLCRCLKATLNPNPPGC